MASIREQRKMMRTFRRYFMEIHPITNERTWAGLEGSLNAYQARVPERYLLDNFSVRQVFWRKKLLSTERNSVAWSTLDACLQDEFMVSEQDPSATILEAGETYLKITSRGMDLENFFGFWNIALEKYKPIMLILSSGFVTSLIGAILHFHLWNIAWRYLLH